MKLSSADLNLLANVAISAATEAGQLIARSRPVEVEHKAVGEHLASMVVTEIDRRSEAIIVDRLTPTLKRFELGLLTEERNDDHSRLSADYFWCIDPLDGTLPFIEGVPGYAVSIALVDRAGMPWIGVVYDPVEATLLHAISGVGAFRDGARWPATLRSGSQAMPSDMLSVFADRSLVARSDKDQIVEALGEIAHKMGLSGVRWQVAAGAVMNACGVLANAPACYFKPPVVASGGGSLWDFAATACLFDEVGAIATDFRGAPLDLNRADSTFMNHRGVLFATDEALAAQVQRLPLSES